MQGRGQPLPFFVSAPHRDTAPPPAQVPTPLHKDGRKLTTRLLILRMMLTLAAALATPTNGGKTGAEAGDSHALACTASYLSVRP
ncbi:hypothetical protein SAMN04488092_104336 [Thalassovita taeanensis]|uniref:Uncharacterized protein n=1 Tax=Thalassovita taeanensis TaxID=657014 RepID=A0A1H9DYY2_9RHOB|nr:hypothetical protein SAMN04488092_104336 [Thalassovita taeanensis]